MSAFSVKAAFQEHPIWICRDLEGSGRGSNTSPIAAETDDMTIRGNQSGKGSCLLEIQSFLMHDLPRTTSTTLPKPPKRPSFHQPWIKETAGLQCNRPDPVLDRTSNTLDSSPAHGGPLHVAEWKLLLFLA